MLKDLNTKNPKTGNIRPQILFKTLFYKVLILKKS